MVSKNNFSRLKKDTEDDEEVEEKGAWRTQSVVTTSVADNNQNSQSKNNESREQQ